MHTRIHPPGGHEAFKSFVPSVRFFRMPLVIGSCWVLSGVHHCSGAWLERWIIIANMLLAAFTKSRKCSKLRTSQSVAAMTRSEGVKKTMKATTHQPLSLTHLYWESCLKPCYVCLVLSPL
eukprot:549739-Amphidinium_carterae.2